MVDAENKGLNVFIKICKNNILDNSISCFQVTSSRSIIELAYIFSGTHERSILSLDVLAEDAQHCDSSCNQNCQVSQHSDHGSFCQLLLSAYKTRSRIHMGKCRGRFWFTQKLAQRLPAIIYTPLQQAVFGDQAPNHVAVFLNC